MPCTSEPEALAIAVGMKLGGAEPLVFMQDSGFLNCLNNYTSLCRPYEIWITSAVKEVSEPEHHKYSNSLFKIVWGLR